MYRLRVWAVRFISMRYITYMYNRGFLCEILVVYNNAASIDSLQDIPCGHESHAVRLQHLQLPGTLTAQYRALLQHPTISLRTLWLPPRDPKIRPYSWAARLQNFSTGIFTAIPPTAPLQRCNSWTGYWCSWRCSCRPCPCCAGAAGAPATCG